MFQRTPSGWSNCLKALVVVNFRCSQMLAFPAQWWAILISWFNMKQESLDKCTYVQFEIEDSMEGFPTWIGSMVTGVQIGTRFECRYWSRSRTRLSPALNFHSRVNLCRRHPSSPMRLWYDHTMRTPLFARWSPLFPGCFHSHICPGSSSPMIPRSQNSDPLDFPSSPTKTPRNLRGDIHSFGPAPTKYQLWPTQTSLQMHHILPPSQTKSVQYGEQP